MVDQCLKAREQEENLYLLAMSFRHEYGHSSVIENYYKDKEQFQKPSSMSTIVASSRNASLNSSMVPARQHLWDSAKPFCMYYNSMAP